MSDQVSADIVLGQHGDALIIDLNPGYAVVVADAKVSDAEGAQVIFGSFNLGQDFNGDFAAVGDSGSEAGHGGLVPSGQAKIPGKLSYLLLGKLCFTERASDVGASSGVKARAEVSEVVGVGAVSDPGEALLFGDGEEPGVQFALTEEAALRAVLLVAGVMGLEGVYDAMLEAELLSEGFGRLQLGAGDAGGVGGDGEGTITEGGVGLDGQERAVDASGIGHYDGA